jgi:hypothetical protein
MLPGPAASDASNCSILLIDASSETTTGHLGIGEVLGEYA